MIENKVGFSTSPLWIVLSEDDSEGTDKQKEKFEMNHI